MEGWANVWRAEEVYPLPNKNEFIIVSMKDLYFVKVKTLMHVNYFAWMALKIPVFVFFLIVPPYIYVLSKEIAIKRRYPPNL